MEERWWNSATVIMEQRNSYGETVERRLWNSGTMIMEQWNRYGGTVGQ